MITAPELRSSRSSCGSAPTHAPTDVWNTWPCNTGPALITSNDGTPTSFGVGVRDHLRSLP